MRSAKSKQPGGVGQQLVAQPQPGLGWRMNLRPRRSVSSVVGAALLLLGVTGCNQTSSAPGGAPGGAPSGQAVQVGATADLAPATPRRIPAPQTGATVTGRAILIGKPPTVAAPATGSDPYCARTTITDEALQVDGQGGLGNVFVRVVEGAGGPYLPPSAPVILTQTGCRYRPRVLGVVRGQAVQVSNSDATLHNVHALLGQSTVLNLVQVDAAAPLVELSPILAVAKTNPLKLRCDVHPWMAAYVWVLDHPFFAVTAADGNFSLQNLAAGEYVLEAWHEELGTQRARLTIPPSSAAATKPTPAEFRFTLETVPSPKAGARAVPAPTSAPTGG